MKKTFSIITAITGFAAITFIIAADFTSKLNALSNRIEEQEQTIEILESYIKSNFYERDAILYLMNSKGGNSEKIKRILADSCKQRCIDFKKENLYKN